MERCRREARGWRWGRACGRTEAAIVAQTAFTFELQPPRSMPIWTMRNRPDSLACMPLCEYSSACHMACHSLA